MIKHVVVILFVFTLFEETTQDNDDESLWDNPDDISLGDLMKATELLGDLLNEESYGVGSDDYHKQLLNNIINNLKKNPDIISQMETIKDKLTSMAATMQDKYQNTNEDFHGDYVVITDDD